MYNKVCFEKKREEGELTNISIRFVMATFSLYMSDRTVNVGGCEIGFGCAHMKLCSHMTECAGCASTHNNKRAPFVGNKTV